MDFDPYTGEITGRPLSVGNFDLNVSATNLAGTGLSSIELVVDKAAPIITSLSPRNVTSTTAYFSASVESDGGAP